MHYRCSWEIIAGSACLSLPTALAALLALVPWWANLAQGAWAAASLVASVALFAVVALLFLLGLAAAVVSIRVQSGQIEWLLLGRFVYRRRPAAGTRVERPPGGDEFSAVLKTAGEEWVLLLDPATEDRLGADLASINGARPCPRPAAAAAFDRRWLTHEAAGLALAAEGGEPECPKIVADALEEAGCDDADILNHLRSPGPHVRGCWALDLILGKA